MTPDMIPWTIAIISKYPRPTDAPPWHVITFTDRRIECDEHCPAAAPHIAEYRALDVQG